MRLSEGFPEGTSPQMVWDAALMARERRRSESIALSLSICSAIGINLGGGDTSKVLRPFYTEAEWDKMMMEADEARAVTAQMQQLAKLRRLG